MQDQNIPIDIQTSKLLEWCINRRHCDKLWPQQIVAVREKINSAIQDMPEHPGITKLLTGTYINYFHCLQIVEILKETEADTRSLFGRYGSQRMKDWLEVVKLYETQNVFLAESAQMFMRNVAYEIPAVKKAIAKCEQVQNECERKEAECLKNANDFREKYSSLCHQMGIEGKDIKKELVKLLSSLPQMYVDIAKQTQKITTACDYYKLFIKRVTFSEENIPCVPLVNYIIEHGNTTVYEWRYGEPPLVIEEPPLLIDTETKEEANDEGVDYGDGGLDLDTEIELETGDIDWGQIDMLNDAHEAVVDDLAAIDDAVAGIEIKEAGVEGGVAKDNEALTLLDYHKTRNAFIDELLELEAFLRQRSVELQSRSANQSQGFGFSLSQSDSGAEMSAEQLTKMLSQVTAIVDTINCLKIKHLALIRESPSLVNLI
nr:EOG090X07S9 [Sida crystallina]